MEVYKLYKTDQERREREKQELMELSEKELLAEMILEMRGLNRTAKRIQFHQILGQILYRALYSCLGIFPFHGIELI